MEGNRTCKQAENKAWNAIHNFEWISIVLLVNIGGETHMNICNDSIYYSWNGKATNKISFSLYVCNDGKKMHIKKWKYVNAMREISIKAKQRTIPKKTKWSPQSEIRFSWNDCKNRCWMLRCDFMRTLIKSNMIKANGSAWWTRPKCLQAKHT